MSKPTLVILAAGVGSRYGGLKQLDTFSEQGDTILDFSIYDAIQAGFGKVVFIIRKSIEQDFKSFFNSKLKGKIEVEYVFQEIDNIPEKYKDNNRQKPWGTGHALLMAKDVISENFAVINADDFYEIDGDMIEMIYRINEKSSNPANLYATCFEFGTLGDSTLNTIESLKAILFENSNHFQNQFILAERLDCSDHEFAIKSWYWRSCRNR